MKVGKQLLTRLLRCALILGIALAVSGCNRGILDVHGPIAGAERQLLFEALACMLLVVVPVIGMTIFFAWWFRASNRRAQYRPDWSYSGRIEFSIWIVPLLVVLFLGGLAWSGSHDLDPYKPITSEKPPFTVEVVSMDWKWLFVYPDQHVATIGELALPVGRPIQFKMTSATVMNSFFVPGIAGQIYTMAGMQTQLSAIVSDPGRYRGVSAQFSGEGFSDMHFEVLSLNDSEFETWLGKVRQAPETLDLEAYENLANAHKVEPPHYYSQVGDGLFMHAMTAAASTTVATTAHSEPTH